MATKVADTVDVEEVLDFIDKTMERLKSLYEQFFLGLQKQAPAHLHNDVERRIRELMQVQIRNTGLRYRYATLQQKFGSYNSYWRRTLRQIEQGTYIRQLAKISRKAAETGEDIPDEILAAMPKRMRDQVKRDREQALAVAARHRRDSTESDVDGEKSDVNSSGEIPVIGESQMVRNAIRKNQHVVSEADADIDIDAFFASVSDDTNPDAKAFPSLEDDDEPTGFTAPPKPMHAQPRPGGAPAARPAMGSDPNSGQARQPRAATEQEQPPQRQSQPIPAQQPPRAASHPPAPPQRQSQPIPAQQPPQRQSQPIPAQQPPRAASQPPAPPQRQSQPIPAQPFPPQRQSQPIPTPQYGQPPPPPPPHPQAGVRFVAPSRAGTQPGVQAPPPPPSRTTGPVPVVPQPRPIPAAPSQVTRPNPIAPGASQQRTQIPVQSMQGPFPRPPRAEPAPPMRPPPGMNDADVNALYAKYVKAKQAVGEDAGPGAYGKLLKTINSQAPKIMEQYKAKGVEFSVVVKDNQVIIKAKPKP